jgi:2-polyprenyl-6-hydroxyphenyl methylase/3-demethylubiquinone-9 3-methyltransferase
MNIDHGEVKKFEQLASRWWDPNSEFKPLHEINPLRLDYINQRTPLAGKRVLDVGCGGGILAEAMAHLGAQVTGIDAGKTPLDVAKLHLLESGLQIDYRQVLAEELALEMPGAFDLVTCMEMLEHVPDPASVIKSCAALVKPGGQVFFSTINRNPKSWLFAIVGAEYVLNLLPKGTHDYAKFIRPSELHGWAEEAGLQVDDLIGMTYNPFTQVYKLGKDVDVNYILASQKPLTHA